jgi:hypothetical protein
MLLNNSYATKNQNALIFKLGVDSWDEILIVQHWNISKKQDFNLIFLVNKGQKQPWIVIKTELPWFSMLFLIRQKYDYIYSIQYNK